MHEPKAVTETLGYTFAAYYLVEAVNAAGQIVATSGRFSGADGYAQATGATHATYAAARIHGATAVVVTMLSHYVPTRVEARALAAQDLAAALERATDHKVRRMVAAWAGDPSALCAAGITVYEFHAVIAL
jgi:hypothetical protein